MNTDNLYPVCTILYKTDNSAGWHYAIMSGDEKECTKECEKLKKQNRWHDYKCYVSTEYLENWLNSLKWQYDEELPYVPWEYSLIKWNKKDTDRLEKFADMIYQTAEPHEILEDEPLERFTCRLIGDYYYAVSEKDGWDCICRTYFHSYKLKDILRFMKSSEFNYKKGMSLKDIYNQLTDKGYNIAVECKYHGKEIEIYANGQADSKTAGKDETKELEQLIIKLTKNIKDKENLTVSELVDILGDHIDSISYRDGKMKI